MSETLLTTTVSNGNVDAASAALGMIAGLGIGFYIIAIIVAIIMIISWWKIFQKAGKPGWAAIVPIYNAVVEFQIAGLNPWLLLLCLIPFVGGVIGGILGIIATYRIVVKFGKGVGFFILTLLFPEICYPILAFSSAKFEGATAEVKEEPATTTEE